MMIRELSAEDWQDVSRIYDEGAVPGKAVLHRDRPTWEEWDGAHLKLCRLVAEEGTVLGWAALRPISDKCVDRGVAKVSAYVAQGYRGKGIGRALINALIEASEKDGIWSLQANVIRENTTSIRLCEASGFRMVGYHERVNRDDDGAWHDLVIFERRSKTVEETCSCGCGGC